MKKMFSAIMIATAVAGASFANAQGTTKANQPEQKAQPAMQKSKPNNVKQANVNQARANVDKSAAQPATKKAPAAMNQNAKANTTK